MFFKRGNGVSDRAIFFSLDRFCDLIYNKFANRPKLIFGQKFEQTLSKKGKKKGQVTIFIILGILLLISVALLLLLRSEQVGFDISEIIPTEKGVVENYISNCINQVGSDALDLVGLQGGYIELPSRYTNDVSWHIPISDFVSVPLWASANIVDQPSLSQIKNEVDEYIEENVRNCLFENEIADRAFGDSYTIIELDDIESDIKFEDKHTDFDITWDIVVQDKSGEVVSEIINHNARSKVQFKTMYETANDILNTEMNELKLEDITQDLIALEHDNLPVAGFEISCAPKQWKKSEVKETLQEMLRINIRSLRVEGSSFTDYSDDFPYYQNHFIWNIDGDVSDDVEVTFRYEKSYPFTFQVTPTSGNYMRSNQMGGGSFLDFLCIQQWKFTYDTVYPVMIQVFDEDTNAVLQMGVSVNLIGNYPDKGGVVYSRESYLGASAYSQAEFCEESSYILPISVNTYSEISNGANGVYYREALGDVNVSYTCVRYNCFMGSSEYDYEQRGDVAGLTALIPYCSGGILRGEKGGYLDSWIFTDVREGDEHDLNLRPLHSIPLTEIAVVEHLIKSRDCDDGEAVDANGICVTIDLEGNDLSSDETAMITMQMIEDDNLESINSEDETGEEENEGSEIFDEYNYFSFEDSGNEIHSMDFVLSPSLETDFLDEAVVEFLYGADFEYKLVATLVNEEELIGGYKDDNLKVEWMDLKNADTVTFHVFKLNKGDDEYYNILAGLDEYSAVIPGIEIEVEAETE
jgi:hypothetical protein